MVSLKEETSLALFHYKVKHAVQCFAFIFMHLFLFTVMAGMAPEGSQFDARQYDSKMSDM